MAESSGPHRTSVALPVVAQKKEGRPGASLLDDSEMPPSSKTGLPRLGIPGRPILLVYERDDLSGESPDYLGPENGDVPYLPGLCRDYEILRPEFPFHTRA